MTEKTDIACALLQAAPHRYIGSGATPISQAKLAREVDAILEALHPLKVVTLCAETACNMPAYEEGRCKAHAIEQVPYVYSCKLSHTTTRDFPKGDAPLSIDCEHEGDRSSDYHDCTKRAGLVGPL